MTEKILLQEIWRWFWIGVAFSIGMTAVSFSAMSLMWTFSDKIGPNNGIEGIEIVEHSAIKTTNGVKIVGKVLNGSDDTKRQIQLRATFLTDGGKVIDVYEGEVSAIVKPSEEVAFKIQCGNGSIPLKDYSNYEISVANTWGG